MVCAKADFGHGRTMADAPAAAGGDLGTFPFRRLARSQLADVARHCAAPHARSSGAGKAGGCVPKNRRSGGLFGTAPAVYLVSGAGSRAHCPARSAAARTAAAVVATPTSARAPVPPGADDIGARPVTQPPEFFHRKSVSNRICRSSQGDQFSM